MRRTRIAVLSALVGAVLVALPLPAQAQHRAVTVAADPFDQVARRTAKGEPVYRDTNGDGVIRPDRSRGVGLSKAMTVDGADEVVLLDTDSASTASSRDGTAAPAGVLADCVRKYGTRAAEAYWWSDTGIKYTFRWVFAVDYQDFGCNGYTSHDDSRYAAQLIAKRLDQPTGAYFDNNAAVWGHYEYYWDCYPGGAQNFCGATFAYRDWGRSAYQSDGSLVYLGTWHDITSERWYFSRSNYLRAVFTAVSPDHTTNVYRGCSAPTGENGGTATHFTAC
jgi:hypothetical protein